MYIHTEKHISNTHINIQPSMFILESEFLLNLNFSDAPPFQISLWKIILFMNIILTQHIFIYTYV